MKRSVILVFISIITALTVFGCGVKNEERMNEGVESLNTTQQETEKEQQIIEQENDEKEVRQDVDENIVEEETMEEAVIKTGEEVKDISPTIEESERVITNEVEGLGGNTVIFSKQKPVTEEEKAIYEWVSNLETEITRVAIWNFTTNRKEILEPGECYQLKEGDKIILCSCGDKISFELPEWLEEVKKYPGENKYYTEFVCRKEYENQGVELGISREGNWEYYFFSRVKE